MQDAGRVAHVSSRDGQFGVTGNTAISVVQCAQLKRQISPTRVQQFPSPIDERAGLDLQRAAIAGQPPRGVIEDVDNQ
nr:hypothetical protein [Halomonas sp. PA5]